MCSDHSFKCWLRFNNKTDMNSCDRVGFILHPEIFYKEWMEVILKTQTYCLITFAK